MTHLFRLQCISQRIGQYSQYISESLSQRTQRLSLNRAIRLIAFNLAIAIAYGMAAKSSMALAPLSVKVAAVWLPSGMTLAAVAWLGVWALPGIALGSMTGLVRDLQAINPPLSSSSFMFLSLTFAAANCLQPLLGIAIIHRLTNAPPAFNQIRAVVSYILAAIVAPALSATLGVTALCAVNTSPWTSYGLSWLTWWIASVVAHLLFTPMLLLWKQRSPVQQPAGWHEAGLLVAIMLGLSWVIFVQGYSVEYALLPLLIWAVFRFGSFFTSVLVSLLSVIAITATVKGLGPYITGSTTQSLLLLQSFIAVCSITTLVLASVVHERIAAEVKLAQALAFLEEQVVERTMELHESKAVLDGFFAAAPVGMSIVDHHLKYVQINTLLAELNGTSIENHLGQTIHQVIPNLAADLEPNYHQVLLTGQAILNREESGIFATQPAVERTWLTSYFPIVYASHAPSKVGVIVMEISDRKRLEVELELQARRDGLTALSNRFHFKEAFESAWQRCCGDQKPFSLIFLDIDQFKYYNDTYGHLAGDACLRQFAQLLRTAVNRAGDLVARYGGEEFVVMLPDTDAERAAQIAKLLRQRTHEQQIPHRSSSICTYVTASFGVATCIANPSLQVNDLIHAADEALYESKRQGRDRITSKLMAQ